MSGWLPRPGIAVICANGWPSGQLAGEEAEQVDQLFGEVVRGERFRRAAQGRRGDLVRARRAPDAEVDPAGMQRLQHAELLGDHQRHMVGQHDVAGPDPDDSVASAIWPISTGGAELAMPGMLWCSATQNRRNPRRSACRARSVVARRAPPAFPPSGTGARSSTERGTARGPKVRATLSTTGPNSAERLIFRPRG